MIACWHRARNIQPDRESKDPAASLRLLRVTPNIKIDIRPCGPAAVSPTDSCREFKRRVQRDVSDVILDEMADAPTRTIGAPTKDITEGRAESARTVKPSFELGVTNAGQRILECAVSAGSGTA